MDEALIYSDGGKNDEKGCYGSFLVTVNSEEKRHKEFTFEGAKTAPEAEAMTLIEALLYITKINIDFPNRINWAVALDAQWLHEHLTINGRKVKGKFQPTIKKAKRIINEQNITIVRISGEVMKEILGH